MFKIAPLPSSFMLTSMVGFFVSMYYVMGLSITWGFTFMLLFVFMFVASMISMVKADAESQFELEQKLKKKKFSK